VCGWGIDGTDRADASSGIHSAAGDHAYPAADACASGAAAFNRDHHHHV
jgi:hypothetical protein